MVAYSTHAATP